MGFCFYALLWLVARRLPVRHGCCRRGAGGRVELLENSPLIINRYRAATIAQGYVGDSVFNSVSDVLMMSMGFVIAFRLRPWMSIALLLAMEIGCAIWVRDNLTLNVIMLIHPIDAIKQWQLAGRPG